MWNTNYHSLTLMTHGDKAQLLCRQAANSAALNRAAAATDCAKCDKCGNKKTSRRRQECGQKTKSATKSDRSCQTCSFAAEIAGSKRPRDSANRCQTRQNQGQTGAKSATSGRLSAEQGAKLATQDKKRIWQKGRWGTNRPLHSSIFFSAIFLSAESDPPAFPSLWLQTPHCQYPKVAILEPSWTDPGSSLLRPGVVLNASWSRPGQENPNKQANSLRFEARRKNRRPYATKLPSSATASAQAGAPSVAGQCPAGTTAPVTKSKWEL